MRLIVDSQPVWQHGTGMHRNWIESTGGPLVLMPRRHTSHWHGAISPGDFSDYARACEMQSMSHLQVGPGQALIIGDEPLRTTYVAEWDLILQWRWARDEETAFRALESSFAGIAWDAPMKLDELNGDELVLFDAAVPGVDSGGEGIIRPGAGGTVTVEAGAIDAGRSAALLLYHLTWSG